MGIEAGKPCPIKTAVAASYRFSQGGGLCQHLAGAIADGLQLALRFVGGIVGADLNEVRAGCGWLRGGLRRAGSDCWAQCGRDAGALYGRIGDRVLGAHRRWAIRGKDIRQLGL